MDPFFASSSKAVSNTPYLAMMTCLVSPPPLFHVSIGSVPTVHKCIDDDDDDDDDVLCRRMECQPSGGRRRTSGPSGVTHTASRLSESRAERILPSPQVCGETLFSVCLSVSLCVCLYLSSLVSFQRKVIRKYSVLPNSLSVFFFLAGHPLKGERQTTEMKSVL